MPDRIKNLAPRVFDNLTYSNHAIEAASNDRFGIVYNMPRTLRDFQLVEVSTEELKFVVRVKLDSQRDLCLVLIPRGRGWLVKTVWINLASDKHRTLQRNKYVQAP